MLTSDKSFASVKRSLLPSADHWQAHVIWLLAIALISMAIPAFFVGVLQLPRPIYLVVYALFVGIALYGYARWAKIDLSGLLHQNWVWGVTIGVLFSVYTVQTVLMQPRSPTPQGIDLVFNLAWLGVVYGALDGLLLSVLPVYATWQVCTLLGWTERWSGRLAAGLLALLVSMLMIGVYHLGYPEFRGPQVMVVMVGVAIQSLGYLITRSPLAPVISHVAMHLAAVVYGIQTVSQLPPHY